MPRLQFLGTGNAHSPPGRMHALLLIDDHILIDSPPTLMPQLRDVGIDAAMIEYILFTHWHGDHMFGFPFLMLDRKYISKTEKSLVIKLRPKGKKILSDLCKIAFPGSLSDILENEVEWDEEEIGKIGNSGWSYERFPVKHVSETDPHGYLLTHQCGFRILHCGDSGPCEEIEKRGDKVDVILVEMGIPNFVNSEFHHSPSDIIKLANKFPEVTILVTHSFTSSKKSEVGFPLPKLPPSVIQLEDGDCLEVDDKGVFYVKK